MLKNFWKHFFFPLKSNCLLSAQIIQTEQERLIFMDAKKILKIAFVEEKTKNCPDLETICSYSDNSIDSLKKKNLEDHFLKCSSCFSIYADLYSNSKNENLISTPEFLMKKTIKPVEIKNSAISSFITNLYKQWSWLSWGSGFAFGAAVILLFIIFSPLLNMNRGTNFAIPGSDTSQVPTTNYIATGYSDDYSATFHYEKGEKLLINSYKEKAKEEFIKAINCNPDFTEAHWQLAMLYEEEGNYKEAQKHWKRYMNLAPKTGSYKEAEEHIKSIKDR